MASELHKATEEHKSAWCAFVEQRAVVLWLEGFLERARKDKDRETPLQAVYGMLVPELNAEKRKLTHRFIRTKVTLDYLVRLTAGEGMGM